MTEEIRQVSNPHYDWQMVDGKHIHRKLSDNVYVKKVKIIYDENGNEITREHYEDVRVEPTPTIFERIINIFR